MAHIGLLPVSAWPPGYGGLRPDESNDGKEGDGFKY